MPEPEIKECESCGAGLLAVSDICPQCGWSKDNHIGADETEEIVDESDSSTKEPTKSKVKTLRPSSIRLLSLFYLIFGISLIIFAISFGAAVTFFAMSSGMSGLAGLGDMSGIGNMGNMMMPFGMGNMDSSTMSSLETIIGLHEIMGTPSVSEIENRINPNEVNIELNPNSILANSASNVDEIMDIIMETTVTAIIEIALGIFAAVIGIGLLKGKKLVRIAIIPSVIIAIPLAIVFVEGIDNLILLGMAAFGGITIYFMFKPKVREYFEQNSIKNSDQITN